jgi:hypothetical protein
MARLPGFPHQHPDKLRYLNPVRLASGTAPHRTMISHLAAHDSIDIK